MKKLILLSIILIVGCEDFAPTEHTHEHNDIYGCTDSTATNFDSTATIFDNTCNYSGCMLEDAPNYNESALLPCTSNCINQKIGHNCCCEEIIYGCMDETAINFADNANAPCNENGIPNVCCEY